MESFTPFIAFHAVAAFFVLVLGPVQILRRRRDRVHRVLGVSWVAAMVVVCVSSFWINAGSFSWLHGLSIWTLLSIVLALIGIRRGNVGLHRGFMVGSYLGTLAAFAFAVLVPTRAIPRLLASEPVVAWGTALGVAAAVAIWVGVVMKGLPVARGRRGRAEASGAAGG